MFKKFFIGFLLLSLIAFGGLTYYVSNIDWNKYKHDIADKFSDITGKEIDFGGKINISLFPKPLMTADNISVYNQGENKTPLATVKKMEMAVSFISLLQGAPDVDSLLLSDAEVWIEQFENNSFNWKNNQGNIITSAENKKTGLRSLNLQNATFHYENKSANLKFDLDKINAEVQASAYDGPYRLDGNFIKSGDHFAIALGIGSLTSLDGIDINLSIAHPASESSFRFDGTYNPQEHNIKGDFSGGSRKTAQIVNTLAEMNLMNPNNQLELQFSSGVEMDANLIKLSSFVTKYGDDIEGSGSLTYPLNVAENEKRQINIKYEFLNFDIRPFIPIIKTKYAEFEKNGGEYLPDTNFNIEADLAAKRLDFSDNDLGYLENITLKANWTENILTVEEFFAAAAGDTSISISGDLREENIKPHYFIKNSIISEDFLSFANALGADLTSYVQSSYHNAEFNFSILGNTEGFSIEGAELSMDKTKINADFNTSFIADIPNFELKAEADMLNFDNYMKKDSQDFDFIAQLENDLKQAEFLKKFVSNIDISATNAVFRSTPISSLIIKTQNKQGLLTIENLSMQEVAGANVNISGNIDLQAENPSFEELKTEIKTSNIADLISQTNFKLPSWKLFKTKKFELSSVTNGTLNDLQTQILINADSMVFDYDGQIKNLNAEVELNGNLGIKTTNIGQFAEAFNFEAKNLPNKTSALNCSGIANIKPKYFSYQQAKCMAGSAHYTGDLSIFYQNEKINVSSKINADDFNLAYLFDFNPTKTTNFNNDNNYDNTFIARPDLSRDILDLNMYKNADFNLDVSAEKAVLKRISFDNIHFKLSNKNNALKLEEIDAIYKNTHYVGDLTLSYANYDLPELKGNLRFNDFDVGLLGGNIYMFNNGKINGNTSFESKGNSVYEIFSNISGYVSMTIEDLSFKGFDFAAINKDISSRKYSRGLFQAIRDNLQSGETEFDQFDITIAMKNGLLTITNLSLNNKYAKSEVSFEIYLKDWKINSKMVVHLKDIKDVPAFEISLNGMLQKPSLEINIENMVKRYDDNIKRIEEQEKAKQEALRAKLNSQMEAAQQNVAEFSQKLNSYTPFFEQYKSKSKKDENISWYNQKISKISFINEDLDRMKTKSHTPDFSAEDVTSINNKIEKYKQDINSWDEEINKRFAEDLDIRFNKLLTAKSNMEMNLQALKTTLDAEYIKELSTLTKIKENNQIETNENLQNKKTEIEGMNTEVNTNIAELDKKLLPINTIKDLQQKDVSLSEAETYEQTIDEKLLELQNIQNKYINELRTTSKNIQKQYEKKQQNTDENSAVLSVLQNNNNINDIEKYSDNNTSKEKNTILKEVSNLAQTVSSDAQDENIRGIIIKNYDTNKDNMPRKTDKKSSLLREVDGPVRKASGTIIVK